MLKSISGAVSEISCVNRPAECEFVWEWKDAVKNWCRHSYCMSNPSISKINTVFHLYSTVFMYFSRYATESSAEREHNVASSLPCNQCFDVVYERLFLDSFPVCIYVPVCVCVYRCVHGCVCISVCSVYSTPDRKLTDCWSADIQERKRWLSY